MTERTDLWIGTRRLFWGFFFLLLDFNLNFNSAFTIPLVPNFIGWIFLWRGVDILSSARPSLGLLRPFCGVLGVYSLTQFVPALEAAAPGWLSLLISVMILYTDFQLLTDLAALAQEALGEGRRVKRLRTARTLIVAAKTALYCYDLVVSLNALAVVLMAVSFCVQVFLLFQLWGLSRDLEKQQSP